MSPNPSSHQQEQATALANRLRTLLDVAESQKGHEVTFAEVTEYLTGRGIAISRARWSYMVNAHRLVDDPVLLDALSDFFRVDPAYLRGEGEMPDSVTAQLDLVRAMRAAKVRSYAARTLGDLSPETLGAITKFLDDEVRNTEGK
ncbi:hypothetical protein [Microbacterium sp. 77mftsu3.1]|uniref:hypothetical protein n=1 Tax=Microbacterium sp. 77mftsu3.1 TaxID=1761802 RepID=UPI0003727AA5|nr:hypothetical protein [Microbacterium sp. 77mftsu3.1]SDH54892.1 hypothetical protein SAMN04488590_3544 [Microbacterium sp. 77mftsu3.1]